MPVGPVDLAVSPSECQVPIEQGAEPSEKEVAGRMPTYEYACTSCSEHLEVAQSFRDAPLEVCPSCGGRLRKVFGSIGVVFKGSGFYKTDSRSSSKPAKTEKSDGSEKADVGGTPSATDTAKSPESPSSSSSPGAKDKAKNGSSKSSSSAAAS